MRICLVHRLHLARRLECWLEGVETQSANAAAYAYDGNKVLLPVAREALVGRVQGEVGVIATVIFWVILSLSFLSFQMVSIKLLDVALISVEISSSLSMIGCRVPLSPSNWS